MNAVHTGSFYSILFAYRSLLSLRRRYGSLFRPMNAGSYGLFPGFMSYKLAENIALQPVDDALVVLDLSGNSYYSLNGTARFFLERIVQNLSIEQIIDEAMDAFDGASRDQIALDLDAALNELRELNIITESLP